MRIAEPSSRVGKGFRVASCQAVIYVAARHVVIVAPTVSSRHGLGTVAGRLLPSRGVRPRPYAARFETMSLVRLLARSMTRPAG